MSRCTPCHDGRTAPERCETCHVSGPLDESKTPKRATAISTAGCTGCHEAKTAQRCIACHGLELPHPPTFMRSHAALSYANPALCAKCHETASAETGCRCHSIDINIHGTYEEWFPVHGSRARSSGPGGCMCHNDNEFIVCAACHERFPWSP